MAGKRSEKVEEAMRLMREEGLSAYAAAKAAGCPQASVYSRIRHTAGEGLPPKCPTCGAPVGKGGRYCG